MCYRLVFGTKGVAQAGGSGLVFFGDLRLYKPRCPADGPRPTGDLSGDCIVDMLNIKMLVGQWLRTVLNHMDQMVDFKDYTVLAQQWLDEQLRPWRMITSVLPHLLWPSECALL